MVTVKEINKLNSADLSDRKKAETKLCYDNVSMMYDTILQMKMEIGTPDFGTHAQVLANLIVNVIGSNSNIMTIDMINAQYGGE